MLVDELVLQGLREIYNSLGTSIAPTVGVIQTMKAPIEDRLAWAGATDTTYVSAPFDLMSHEISERDI